MNQIILNISIIILSYIVLVLALVSVIGFLLKFKNTFTKYNILENVQSQIQNLYEVN